MVLSYPLPSPPTPFRPLQSSGVGDKILFYSMFICINVYCMAKCGPCQNRNVPFNVKDALLLLLQPPSRSKLMLDMATNKYSKGNEIEYIWKMQHALVLFLHAKHHYSRPLYSLNYGIFYPILDFFYKVCIKTFNMIGS